MTTKLKDEIIQDAMSTFFRSEVLTCVLFGILIIIAIIISVLVYKTSVLDSRFKSILLILFVCSCSVGLIVLRMTEFIPIYTDFRNMSYTVGENVEVFIVEGTNNIWEQKNEVQLKTENGEELKLKITNDYKFETGIVLQGTVVYTNCSKHIIWYELFPITD